MLEIDYEKWAKEALDKIVDDDMKDGVADATKLMGKIIIAAAQGKDTANAQAAVQAAINNWTVAGLVASASEAEDLAKKILTSLGDVLVTIGKKAIGLPT